MRSDTMDPPAELEHDLSLVSLGQLPLVSWCVDGEGQCRWAGDEWERRTGLSTPASRDLGWLEAVEKSDRPALLALLMAGGMPDRPGIDLRLCCAANAGQRWHRTRVLRLHGRPEPLFLCVAQDVDDLYRPHEAQARAVAALQHRMRGTFGTIRAIIRRTARFSDSAETFADRLDSRIGALARAQASVIRAPTAGVELTQLVMDELAACIPLVETRVGVTGPMLRLRPRTAELLAMALHELATNALQHGALCHRQGRIAVSWSVAADGSFHIEWRESGCATGAGAVDNRGYGRELLETALPYELKAETRLRFEPGGMCLALRMPAAANIMEGGTET